MRSLLGVLGLAMKDVPREGEATGIRMRSYLALVLGIHLYLLLSVQLRSLPTQLVTGNGKQ